MKMYVKKETMYINVHNLKSNRDNLKGLKQKKQ